MGLLKFASNQSTNQRQWRPFLPPLPSPRHIHTHPTNSPEWIALKAQLSKLFTIFWSTAPLKQEACSHLGTLEKRQELALGDIPGKSLQCLLVSPVFTDSHSPTLVLVPTLPLTALASITTVTSFLSGPSPVPARSTKEMLLSFLCK